MEFNIQSILIIVLIIFLINWNSKKKLENFKLDNKNVICNCKIENFAGQESTKSVLDDDDDDDDDDNKANKLKGIDEVNFETNIIDDSDDSANSDD